MRKNSLNHGFSLIELMVVISIMSFMATIAIPSLAKLHIKAAQAEAMTNLRSLDLMGKAYCEESHATSCIINGSWTLFTYGTAVVGSTPYNQCISNPVGFSTNDCQKLRYFYSFGTSSTGQWATARATYYVAANGTVIAHHGNPNGPPTRLCGKNATYAIFYVDELTFRNDTMYPTNDASNALKACF